MSNLKISEKTLPILSFTSSFYYISIFFSFQPIKDRPAQDHQLQIIEKINELEKAPQLHHRIAENKALLPAGEDVRDLARITNTVLDPVRARTDHRDQDHGPTINIREVDRDHRGARRGAPGAISNVSNDITAEAERTTNRDFKIIRISIEIKGGGTITITEAEDFTITDTTIGTIIVTIGGEDEGDILREGTTEVEEGISTTTDLSIITTTVGDITTRIVGDPGTGAEVRATKTGKKIR